MDKIIEDSKLVAKFMGANYNPDAERSWTKEGGWVLSKVHYRTSYDWLVPVYNRIIKLMDDETDVEVYTPEATAQLNVVIDNLTDGQPIFDLFDSIVHFIEIYNDQKRRKTKGDS